MMVHVPPVRARHNTSPHRRLLLNIVAGSYKQFFEQKIIFLYIYYDVYGTTDGYCCGHMDTVSMTSAVAA